MLERYLPCVWKVFSVDSFVLNVNASVAPALKSCG